MSKRVRGTVDLRTTKKGNTSDPIKVMRHYSNINNIPERYIGFNRASELAFACRWAVRALKEYKAKHSATRTGAVDCTHCDGTGRAGGRLGDPKYACDYCGGSGSLKQVPPRKHSDGN